jgi:uncharacterized damage-inducible protein DinB
MSNMGGVVSPGPTYIRELYLYNDWSNDRVLDAVARVNPELVRRDLENSFGSLLDTLAHIAGAEWIWLERWHGRSPAGLPAGSDFSGVQAVRNKLSDVRSERDRWLSSLGDQDLLREVAYRNVRGQPFQYPLWQQLSHVVNHSTYHRGQVTTMLRQLGQPGVSTDLLLFYDERNRKTTAVGR